MKSSRYPRPKKLMLRVPPENLNLIRELITDAKNTLSPVNCESIIRKPGRPKKNTKPFLITPNLHYLNALILERVTLVPARIQTLMTLEKATVYLTASEFRTITALLKERDEADKKVTGKWHELWAMLTLAEIQFNTLYGPEFE